MPSGRATRPQLKSGFSAFHAAICARFVVVTVGQSDRDAGGRFSLGRNGNTGIPISAYGLARSRNVTARPLPATATNFSGDVRWFCLSLVSPFRTAVGHAGKFQLSNNGERR